MSNETGLHNLDYLRALLREPLVREAIALLDEAAEADSEHALAQYQRRGKAYDLAAEAGLTRRAVKSLRKVRTLLASLAPGEAL